MSQCVLSGQMVIEQYRLWAYDKTVHDAFLRGCKASPQFKRSPTAVWQPMTLTCCLVLKYVAREDCQRLAGT